MSKFFSLICFIFFTFNYSYALELTSNSIKEGKKIPKRYIFNDFGCKGNNISPHLSWSDIPEGTKSFALTVFDLDAPTGSGWWWHWVAFNIPAHITEIAENISLKKDDNLNNIVVESKADYGFAGYGGPCPPKNNGKHRYVFTIYALDIDKLNLDPSVSAALVGFNINKHKLAEAKITSYYKR